MNYSPRLTDRIPLGATSLEVSPITLGTANFGSRWGPFWTLEKTDALRMVAEAFERGVNAFDTANVYNQGESELWLGDALQALKISDQVVVSTKFGYLSNPAEPESGGSGRTAMRRAVAKSLKRLKRDWIDILYLHIWDRNTPVEATLNAAAELIAAGDIRAFALSNIPAWYLARAALLCNGSGLSDGLAAVQLNYNLLTRYLELEYEDVIALGNVDVIAWGPLANGLLAGRYRINATQCTLSGNGRLTGALFSTGAVDPYEPGVREMLERLETIAHEAGLSQAHLALSWLLARKQPVSTVIGVSTLNQLDALLNTAESYTDVSILDAVETATRPRYRYPHNFLEAGIQVLAHGNRAFEREAGPLTGQRNRAIDLE